MTRVILLACFLAPALSTPAGAQSFDELIAKGRAQLDSNKNDDAVKSFEKAVKLNDKHSDAHLWLARAVGSVAQNASVLRQPFLAKRAKSEFDRAAELDPNSVGAHEGLMQFYLRAPGVMGGSINKARDEAAKITKINPYRGHFAANNLANNDKDLAAAEKNWRAMWAAYPDSAAAMSNLAAFLMNNNRGDEAWPVVEKFSAARPDDVLAKWWVVRVAANTGKQLDRAEKYVGELLAIPEGKSPRVAPAALHFRLGDIHAKRGDKGKARAEYETALKLDPKLEPAKKALESLK